VRELRDWWPLYLVLVLCLVSGLLVGLGLSGVFNSPTHCPSGQHEAYSHSALNPQLQCEVTHG